METTRIKIHPGRILLEDYLAPRGISVWHLAKDIGVSARRIYEIVQGQRAITRTSLTASHITSACLNATGSTCKRDMTGREKQNCRKRLAEDNR